MSKCKTIVLLVFTITLVAGSLFVPGRPAQAQPRGCRIDPSGILICEGTQIVTAVPTRAVTVAPSARPPTQAPRPTATPPPPTPIGYQSFWRYCVTNSSSSTGFVNLNIVCPPQGTGNCHVVRTVNASHCAPTTIRPKPLPCPNVAFTLTSIGCVIGWVRTASAHIPPVPITYLPYPRGLVALPIEFMAPGLITQNWVCSSPPVDNWSPRRWAYDEDYRNLYFCLRWRQVRSPNPSPDPAPAWIRYVWDERAWGNPPETLSQQATAEHSYVTSSANKPANGPNGLPAYQVQAHSYWIIDWRETWEHAIRITECKWTGDKDDNCDGQNKYAAKTRTEWQPESDEGTADLRRYGAPHFYADSTLIQTADGRSLNVLPVPVIEIQGVIGNP